MKKQSLAFGKILSIIALPAILAPLVLPRIALADTLRTQNYRVTITVNCPEEEVVCNDVTYDGSNVNTGESLQLQGRTVSTLCADGVTPCRFIGYEFFNGDYRYLVTEEGRLQVSINGEIILDQSGNWEF